MKCKDCANYNKSDCPLRFSDKYDRELIKDVIGCFATQEMVDMCEIMCNNDDDNMEDN